MLTLLQRSLPLLPLTIAMTHPDRYRSVSAFAPIANPTESDWGRKQLGAYLGEDRAAWQAHDSTLLMAERGYPGEVLIDQGASDQGDCRAQRCQQAANATAAGRGQGGIRGSSGIHRRLSRSRKKGGWRKSLDSGFGGGAGAEVGGSACASVWP